MNQVGAIDRQFATAPVGTSVQSHVTEQALPPPSCSGIADSSATLLVLSKLLQSMSNDRVNAKATMVERYHGLAERAIQDAHDAQMREAEAEDSKGGFLSDIVKACSDVLNDAVHLRVADAVSDLKDDTVNDPQFWKDLASTGATVAKWAAVAGSVALATGLAITGVGGPLAVGLAVTAAVLTTAGAAETEFHVLEKLGVNADVAQWIGLGLSLGGAAAGAGAGLAAAAVAEEGQAANALASASSSGTSTTTGAADTVAKAKHFGELATCIGREVDTAAAVGGMVGGVGKAGAAYYQSEALNAQADVGVANNREKFVRHLIELVQKCIEDTYKDASDATANLSSTMAAQNQAMLTCYARI